MDIILSAKGISKTYTAGQVKINALNRCDIEVRKGGFTAIVGKSGSGKSTLLRILGTMDKPDEGKVYIAGKDISNLKNSELAKFRRTHIGFIYQDYKLIPEYTAYENIILPLILDSEEDDEEEVTELMESLGIDYCKAPAGSCPFRNHISAFAARQRVTSAPGRRCRAGSCRGG